MSSYLRRYILDARTATPHFPGIGRYVHNLIQNLPEQLTGEESLCVLLPSVAAGAAQAMPWGTQLPPALARISSPATPFGLAQQWQVPRLLRAYVNEQARPSKQPARALYHSTYYLMPYRPGLATVLTVYDLIPMIHPASVSPRARWLFQATTWLALRASAHVLAISESTRQDLITRFGVAPERVSTVPLAAAARFQPQPANEIQRVREQYDLPADFLFYMGINKPHKNLVRLVQAYAQLDTQLDADAPPLVIAGAWDARYPESQQVAAALGLGERVRFLGPTQDHDLPALYAACTLFVFPSLYEGFGLPVVEAMACGAAVACGDAPGLRDVAGDAVLLFDPYDTDAIAATLRRVIGNATLLADLRARALVQAQQFSWRATAQQTLAVYRQVLQNVVMPPVP